MAEMVMPAVPGTGATLRQGVHEHADFAVFGNGAALDFNDARFLSTETFERSQSVHLHAPRTNVAHLRREQTTFDEFFLSLGMELTDDCLKLDTGEKLCNDDARVLQFMVNGVRVDRLQFEKLSDMSWVLISFGPRGLHVVAGPTSQAMTILTQPNRGRVARDSARESRPPRTFS